MANTIIIFISGIVLAMVIGSITSGRRRPNSHISHDTTNESDFVYFGSDDNHYSHHHGYADHSTGSDFSIGDSGTCDSGGCDGGGCDGGGCD